MKKLFAALILLIVLASFAFAQDAATGNDGRNTVLKFLKDCRENGAYFIATIDNDQPRVRPFSSIAEYNGKLYICTNNQKKVYQQIQANPKVEISGLVNGDWLRLTTKLVQDDSTEAKQAMLDQNPSLNEMYKVDDGIFVVFYFEEAKANILSFTGRNDVIKF